MNDVEASGLEPKNVLGRLAVSLATGLGIGFVPFAPGTFGTIWGLPIAYVLVQVPLVWQIVTLLVLFAVGIPICDMAAKHLQMKDPGCVVWDEFVTLPMVFVGFGPEIFRTPWVPLLGFALHRVFDISKLPPGRQLEKLPGGLGIMADDLAAAAYAWVALWLVIKLVPGLHGG